MRPSLSSHSRPQTDILPVHSDTLNRTLSFPQAEPCETFTYTYDLIASNTHTQILISIEPEADRPNCYTFSLSMKIGYVERAISKPVTMKLSVDPRKLDFVVFMFPPRSSLPVDCLFHLRVWLRTAGVDHRIFAERDLWFGKEPDFRAVPEASFAHLRTASRDTSAYHGIVGRVHVNFIFRWTLVEPGTYALALDYEAGGAGKTLFENYHLRLSCEPAMLSFVIYSVPVPSTPAGASHRLRVWLRIPPASTRPPNAHSQAQQLAPNLFSYPPIAAAAADESRLYLRLWKSDDFKIGAHLPFDAIKSKIVLATRAPDSSAATTPQHSHSNSNSTMPLVPNRRRVSRLLVPDVGIDDPRNSVNDR